MARASRKAKKDSGVLSEVIPEELRRGAKTFLKRLFVALVVVTILCCMFVILRNYVSGFDCYQVCARTLVPRNLPSWAGEAVRRELSVLPGVPESFSIMEPGICSRIAGTFRKNPWVDEVLSVRKVYPNRIVVAMRLRRPVAGVRVGGRHYLVDARGCRLTPALKRWPGKTDAPPALISSARGVPELGAVWGNEGVRAGAAVAHVLLDSRDKLDTRFAAIDVTNVGGRRSRYKSEILLITRRGTVVRWGRSPLLDKSPGELTPDVKVRKMILFEKKRGPLSGYRYVDIRFDDVQHGARVRMLSSRGLIR